MEVYLIRHAQTVMNANPHLVGGRSNHTPLTDYGVSQAQKLGKAMHKKGIIPTRVFVSPAKRTIDTAKYSLEAMGLDIEPEIEDDLQELSQGDAEGKPRVDIYTSEVLTAIDEQGKDFKFKDGESMNDVAIRMYGWMNRTFATKKNKAPQRVFVYTHGGTIKYLISHLLDWPRKQTYDQEMANTSVTLLVLEDNGWRIEYINKLPEEL